MWQRQLGRWIILALCLGAPPVHAQNVSSQGYVPGGSTNPIAFDELKWCEGGSTPGGACTSSGDCSGGTCVTVWVQMQAPSVPSWAVTRNEQRTVGTSAVDAFSTAAKSCWSVRVKNIGTITIVIGWSGLTTSNGVPIEPGEWGPPMYPPNRDCNAVKLRAAASGGAAAVITP